ncbi:MAG: NUDIX domain-containing protein [Acholeplasmataceae bacterium]|nr:NUDIX domain-containing protein [Acholeplasmataceae bacterium]
MVKEKSCGAVIFRKHQNSYQFMIIKQRFGLHFGFPKGHVEKNESELMTAKREVKEEVGLDIKIFEHLRDVTNYHPRPSVSKEVVYFLAEATSDQVILQKDEVDQAIWVDQDDVLNKLTYETDKHIFRNLLEKAKLHG